MRLGRAPSGLAVTATVDADGAPSTFGPADVPAELPAVVSGPGAAGAGSSAVGLDGATISVRPVAVVGALPAVGSGPAMVDLSMAERLQSGPMLDTALQVWLSAGPDGALVHRLETDGITPVNARSAAAQYSMLSKGGVSLAYSLSLVAAIAAAVLAVGSTVFAVTVAARRRTTELASLRAAGVGQAALRRSLVVEQVLVVGVGVVVGLAAGLIAALVALPSVPEFVGAAIAPALSYRLPLGALALIMSAIVVSLGLTIGLASYLVVRGASAEKLGGETQ